MRSASRSLLLSLFASILVIGLALRSWELLFCLIPLTLLVYVSSYFLYSPVLELEVRRSLSTNEAVEGDRVQVRLEITNLGPAVHGLWMKDRTSNGLDLVEGETSVFLDLRSGERRTIEYVVVPRSKGRFLIGPFTASSQDIMRLFHSSFVHEEESEVRVVPRTEEIKRCSIRPYRLRPYSGNLNAANVGQGTEFFNLRDYLPGDELRKINWKASARSNDLIVNEKESERSGDVVVALDLRSMETSRMKDRCLETTVGLASFYLRERNRVGMVAMGDYIDLVQLGSGRRQLYRITEKLITVRSEERRPPLSLERAWRRYFTPDTLLIIINGLQDDLSSLQIKRLVRAGAQVVVIAPYDDRSDAENIKRLAKRIELIRRDDIIFDLRQFCQVIEWNISSPLSKNLAGVRTSRPRK